MTGRLDLVDTHCHLHFDDYDADREEVLKASAAAGVTRLICVGCSLDDSRRAIDFAQKHSGVWATAGAHPHDGAAFLSDKQAATKLKKMLAESKVVAVGEIGLDYYRDITPKVDQEKTLRPQLEIGLEAGLPFVFHVREAQHQKLNAPQSDYRLLRSGFSAGQAWDDFWRIFDSYKGITGVIHSFSANPERLGQALERGMYIALNGLMTYTKDESWLAAARQVPLDKLVLETDAPFLTPVPRRGRRNEPAYTADTWRFLAELRGEEPEKLARQTTKNALKLFDLK